MSIHPLHIADGVLGVSCGVCKLPHIFKCIEWVGSCVKRKVLMKLFKDKTDDMVENKSEMCLSENSMEHVGRERIDVHTYHTGRAKNKDQRQEERGPHARELRSPNNNGQKWKKGQGSPEDQSRG